MMLDWTRSGDVPVSGYTQFLQTYDWASTSLGSIQHWPTLLRQQVCQIVSHPDPRILLWGPELAFLYNEAAIRVIKQRAHHPDSLGQPAKMFWAESIAAGLGAMITLATNSGQATRVEDFPVPLSVPRSLALRLESTGRICMPHSEPVQMSVEESYFTFTMVPIFDENGEVVAVLDEFTETTRPVIANRRVKTVLRLEDNVAKAHSMNCIWKMVLEALDPNIEDVPFALLYSVNYDTTLPVHIRLHLEGTVGVSTENSISDLTSNESFFRPWMERAWASGKPVIASFKDIKRQPDWGKAKRRYGSDSELSPATKHSTIDESGAERLRHRRNSSPLPTLVGSRPKEAVDNIDYQFIVPGRGHDTAINSALIVPIPRLNGPDPIGVLVMAMNPLRPYDNDYRNFIRHFTETMVRAVATIAIPEEQRRQHRAAEEMSLRHAKVSAHLLQRTWSAERTEARFRYLAEMAPVGMCLFEPDGKAMWANKVYMNQLNLPQEEINNTTWKSSLHPDDHSIIDASWRKLEERIDVGSFELRVRQRDHPLAEDYTWLLCDATAQYDSIGKIETVTCWYYYKPLDLTSNDC
jgi:PAS domain-containing protein